jgi:scyllo-inositol 2-dehydrogenase (NAD+)
VKTINVGVIGTGWCGGIRANTCASSALVGELHIAEVDVERLREVQKETNPTFATNDYHELISNDDIDAIMVSTTPETTHYPIARESLLAGKHVLLEKPLALTLHEADELIKLARDRDLKFTVGYSQRFNPKFAYIKKSLEEGTIGTPVSALISRHISRKLGDKIGGRIKLSPAAMEATHDIDIVLWCLEPARPIRVYSQVVSKVMHPTHGVDDCQWIVVTMDDGTVFTIGAGWILPPAYPNFSSTWVEFVGSEGALIVDDSHRDTVLTTMKGGIVHPMSTMPGESVGHVYAGPMDAETVYFLESVSYDRPVLVTAEQARRVMELYIAADLSAERNDAVALPLEQEVLTSMVA